jgi:Icc-related predicted phosphoesterase
MPRLRVISDLHLELLERRERRDGVLASVLRALGPCHPDDVLVVAGDLGSVVRTDQRDHYVRALRSMKAAFPTTLVVGGNHEMMGAAGDLDAAEASLRAACEEAGVTCLQRDTVRVGGITIAGCTLWSPVTPTAFARMMDSKHVFTSHAQALAAHARDAAWLEGALATGVDVVVTHHLPTLAAVHARFLDDSDMNTGFVAPLLDRGGPLPRVWVCGHTHEAFAGDVNGVRVLCNPLGYTDELRHRKTAPWWEGVDV